MSQSPAEVYSILTRRPLPERDADADTVAVVEVRRDTEVLQNTMRAVNCSVITADSAFRARPDTEAIIGIESSMDSRPAGEACSVTLVEGTEATAVASALRRCFAEPDGTVIHLYRLNDGFPGECVGTITCDVGVGAAYFRTADQAVAYVYKCSSVAVAVAALSSQLCVEFECEDDGVVAELIATLQHASLVTSIRQGHDNTLEIRFRYGRSLMSAELVPSPGGGRVTLTSHRDHPLADDTPAALQRDMMDIADLLDDVPGFDHVSLVPDPGSSVTAEPSGASGAGATLLDFVRQARIGRPRTLG